MARKDKITTDCEPRKCDPLSELIGESSTMKHVFERIQHVAAVEVDVLIIGETGTGKELVARAIHQCSSRNEKPFVAVNCGAIPHDLMESEFFGHERGAFTGALVRRTGLLESANHGTFFLDELNNLPLGLQSKLLRVLQERTIRRVGGTNEVSLDLRVVAASSVDLEGPVQAHQFREDLYHRINIARIMVPALRNRAEDIPLLSQHFIRRHAARMGKAPPLFSPEALELMARYIWPGNVRQLENIIQGIIVMANHEKVHVHDLPDEIFTQLTRTLKNADAGYFNERNQQLEAFEKKYLRALMTSHLGEISAAARKARLPRSTLYRLLKKHRFDPIAFRHQQG